MCFLFQAILFAGTAAIAGSIYAFLHAPVWVAGISGFLFLVIAWIGYLYYQAKHPQWWPPWDEGLPQTSRMLSVFVPVAQVFLVVLILTPVFQKVGRNARRHRAHMQHKHSGVKQNTVGTQPGLQVQ